MFMGTTIAIMLIRQQPQLGFVIIAIEAPMRVLALRDIPVTDWGRRR